MRYLESANSDAESRIWLPGFRGGRNGELLFNGYRNSVWGNEKVLEMDSDDDCIIL
jgi:hypothetical protein